MHDRDELDALIDSALANYAEPRPGLEQRILAGVESASSSRSTVFHRWPTWSIAGFAAISIVLLITIPRMTERQAPIATARAISPDHGSPAPVLAPHAQARTPRLVRPPKASSIALRRPKPAEDASYSPRPKLDTFPSPRPLSSQEQALVALATHPSDSGREGLAANQRQPDAPLQISAIQIPPITMPDEGNN